MTTQWFLLENSFKCNNLKRQSNNLLDVLRSDFKERGDRLRSGRDIVKLREMIKNRTRCRGLHVSDCEDNMFSDYFSHGNSNISIIQSGYSTRALADLFRRRNCSVGSTDPRCKKQQSVDNIPQGFELH